MKKLVFSLLTVVLFIGTAFTQTYDFWLWNGLATSGTSGVATAVSPTPLSGISSVTLEGLSTGTANFLYRNTNWTQKWGAAASLNSMQTMLFNGADGTVSITLGNYYTLNVPTTPTADDNNILSILETSAEPVTITSVTRDFLQPIPEEPVEITVTLSATKTAEELVYIVWTKDNWDTYTANAVAITGTSGTTTLSAQPEGTDISYYAITTTIASASWGSDKDYAVLRVNNNVGTNYNYTSSNTADNTPPTTVSDLTASADPDLRKITLTWTPVTEDNFDTYEIFYSTEGTPTESSDMVDKTDYISLGTIGTSSITLSLSDWDTDYFFAIRGSDASGNKGTLSNVDKAKTPAEPFILMDGVFDGTEKWGAPVYTATNTTDGWAGANATNLYVTYDDNYTYLGAEIAKEGWQYWVFVINTKSGGASQDSWSRNVFYDHADKPDFCVRQGGSSAFAQFNTWDGLAWTYDDGTIAEDSWYKLGSNFVEVRISRAMLENEVNGDIQFYITGDNGGHGAFDCLPDDDNSTDWSAPGVVSNLAFYAAGVTLPVELASFTVTPVANGARLSWETATETNNAGFEVLKNGTSIGFVAGKGTTTDRQSYSFTDKTVTGKVTYQLKQIDTDGSVHFSNLLTFSGQVSSFEVLGNYPNPFNPSTVISYQLSEISEVNLKVYDVTGRLIEELVNGKQEAGLQSIPFNASNLSSGLYYYQVSANGKVQTGKMILMK